MTAPIAEAANERHLPIEGTYNLRDVGGYETEDGQQVRWRTLFRSDSLHKLTAEAQAELLATGLSTIVDLRRAEELSEQPSVFAEAEDVSYLNIPLLGGPRRGSEPSEQPAAFPSLAQIYRTIVDDRAEQLVQVISAFAEPGGLPGLVHCTAGKDRTGVVIALMLRVVGVPAETIAADYALTEAQLAKGFFDEHRKSVEARGVDWEKYQVLLASPPELMLDFLQYVDEQHGGAEAFLLRSGMTSEQLASLRAALLD